MTFEAYYDTHWLPEGDYFRIHRQRFLQSWDFIEAQNFAPVGTVLDVGGIGPLSAYLEVEHGWTTHQTKTDLRYPLPIPSDTFELVICTETIEHIKDVESSEIKDLESFNYSGVIAMLTELRRALRSDGGLFISTPNANSLITLEKWLDGELLLMDPHHVREFSIRELGRIALQAGFCTQAVRTVDSWETPRSTKLAALEKRLAESQDARQVERGDNIFALFTKTPETRSDNA